MKVVTEGISARLDEQKIESRNLRAGMNARFDKVDDRFGKLDAKVDNRFGKLDEKIEKLDTKVSDRFEKLEAKFDDRFEKLETKFDDRFERFEAKFDAKFDRVDTKFDRVDARFDQVRVHARSDFHLLFGSLIASALGLAGMMAKGFGWF